jgi:RNA polymerase sigma factor (sigma-70 family)
MIPTNFEPEQFEKLLNWLSDDRETAGEKYALIRDRLVRIFYARGSHQADDLADETIDRVAKKIDTIYDSYEGDPALYFYAVARNVFLESTRAPRAAELTDNIYHTEPDDAEAEVENDDRYHECLEKCLQKLDPAQREFIIGYYSDSKRAKVERRKSIAAELGISDKALRIRAFRLRENLRKCITACIRNFQPV